MCAMMPMFRQFSRGSFLGMSNFFPFRVVSAPSNPRGDPLGPGSGDSARLVAWSGLFWGTSPGVSPAGFPRPGFFRGVRRFRETPVNRAGLPAVVGEGLIGLGHLVG